METNGLCLEEYRDFLRQGPRSVALENGRMAQVFYVPAAGAVTEVEVPEGCCQIWRQCGGIYPDMVGGYP